MPFNISSIFGLSEGGHSAYLGDNTSFERNDRQVIALSQCFNEKAEQAVVNIKKLRTSVDSYDIIGSATSLSRTKSNDLRSRLSDDIGLYPRRAHTSWHATILNKIIEAYNSAPANSKYISVDLRNYRSIIFENLVITNFPTLMTSNLSSSMLRKQMKNSKFVWLNFGEVGLRIRYSRLLYRSFDKSKLIPIVDRSDLYGAEIVFNASQSSDRRYSLLAGNLRFSAGLKISILADNFTRDRGNWPALSGIMLNITPLYSNFWTMNVLSVRNSQFYKAYFERGNVKYIVNDNATFENTRFIGMKKSCYYDEARIP
jgi:hypothetical protein